MVLKLYTHDNSPRTQKVLIAAKYAGVNVEVVSNVDTRSEDFLRKNPTGKVPVLETDKGTISESNAIARYIAREGKPEFHGKSSIETALIDQWIDFAASEIELAAYAWIFPIQGVIPNNFQATKKAQEDIKKVLSILDNHLLTRTYLVGNSVSLADVVVATSLLQLYQLVLDPAFRKEFVNTNRWFVTIVNQPEVKAVLGEVKLADKAAVAPAAPKEKKEKAPKEVKAPAPKAEKKAEKPVEKKPAADEEEEEDYEKDDKKKKNPLDDLPKSSFILDEWKRMYSNNDTRTVAAPWFWEHLDKEGYSLWWCDYKYNDELSKTFMTSNLIGGFFQRLEKLHKYAFGSMIIFGEEPQLTVSGVWLFRGLDIPEDMKACDDAEHYNWKKVDTNNPAEKKLVEDYFAWDGELGGKKFNAGKTFK
jgi:elongation factor 1-gamma